MSRCFLSFLFFVSNICLANDFEILVDSSLGSSSSAIAKCDVSENKECNTSLHDAWALLGSKYWRNKLVGKINVVRVRLVAGRYFLQNPLFLEWGKDETTNISLEIVGSGFDTILSGGERLTAWFPLDPLDSRREIVKKYADKIQVVSVRDFNLPVFNPPSAYGFSLPIRPLLTDVYQNDKSLVVAKWPNSDYGKIFIPEDSIGKSKRVFKISDISGSDFLEERDLMVHAFWFHDWASQSYPVSVNSNGDFEISGDGSPYGIKNGQRVRIENALQALDSPGEWYLDRKNEEILAWLPDATAPVDLAVAEGVFRIRNSVNILFRNFSIEKTRGDAIHIKDSSHVVFEDVNIRHTGNRAVVIFGGSYCGIRRALIEHNGEGGLSFEGGNRSTLVPAGHFVEHSIIRDFSRLSKTYRFAVQIDGVGMRVVGNSISKSPHTAILFQGNDHFIGENEIFDVVTETSDAGAIYTGRDFTSRGTVIEGNFLHDIQAFDKKFEVKGVYLDDQASGVTVINNIFAHVQQPVFIGGGRDNVVKNNIFYFSSPAVHLDARGLNWERADTLNPSGTLQTRLDAVPYREDLWRGKYKNLANIREDDFGSPKYNIACGNVVVNGKAFSVAKEASAGIDLNSFYVFDESVFLVPVSEGGRISRYDFKLKNNFAVSCS